MKTEQVLPLVSAALLTILSQANAGDEVGKNQVPKAVLEAFAKAYPHAKDVKFENESFEGNKAYEVEYKDNGKDSTT